MDVSVFPLGLEKHFAFCLIASLIFLIQFLRTKYWYELLMAITVPLSLLVHVNDSPVWFYGIGIFEAVLLLIALVAYCVQYAKNRAKEKAEKAAKEAQEAAEAEMTEAAETETSV